MGDRLYAEKPMAVRRKAKPGPDETMEALRETRNSPKGRGPRRIGEIEVGPGDVEVGYDEKRRRLHLAFLQEQRAGGARTVVESSAAGRRAGPLEYSSNDPRFSQGAVELCAAPDLDARRVLRDLREAEGRGGCAALERVLPLSHGPEERCARAFAAELRELVEPLRVHRGGDDLLLLLRKKRGEEEAESGAVEPAETEPIKNIEGVEHGSR